MQQTKTAPRSGISAWAGQLLFATAAAGILLFVSAGTLDWIGGWLFFGLNLITQLVSALILIPRQPDMLADRSQVRPGTKSWDRFLAPAVIVFGTLALIITAGLDRRFTWTGSLSASIWIPALIVAAASQGFVLWAMASNRFFATTVRIQEERQHQVQQSGPYGIVRHPGYAGSVLYTLAIPFVLGSYWTLIPAVITVVLLIIRTRLEDRTLQAELPGYREYARRVCSRLLPGVW